MFLFSNEAGSTSRDEIEISYFGMLDQKSTELLTDGALGGRSNEFGELSQNSTSVFVR